MPFSWIEDASRWLHKPACYVSPREALDTLVEGYRKDLWSDLDQFVEIWVEKESLAGIIYDVTQKHTVPLRPAHGYSSITFLHDAAKEIEAVEKPAFIYLLGDLDPSGDNAHEVIERELREYAPDAQIHCQRLAVTFDQYREWNLPSHKTNKKDPRAKKFEAKYGIDFSIELDAIEPNQLRAIVETAIKRHMPARLFKRLKTAEQAEREQIEDLVATLEDE